MASIGGDQMGVLIAIIVIGGVIGAIGLAESVQEKKRIKQLEERDDRIWEQLQRKYSKVPESELYWIYQELNWVCESLWDDAHSGNWDVDQMILAGTYDPLYPVGTAKQKLQTINQRYGWTGSDAIQFSRETSVSSVYENRYFLACMFAKNVRTTYSFHYRDD